MDKQQGQELTTTTPPPPPSSPPTTTPPGAGVTTTNPPDLVVASTTPTPGSLITPKPPSPTSPTPPDQNMNRLNLLGLLNSQSYSSQDVKINIDGVMNNSPNLTGQKDGKVSNKYNQSGSKDVSLLFKNLRKVIVSYDPTTHTYTTTTEQGDPLLTSQQPTQPQSLWTRLTTRESSSSSTILLKNHQNHLILKLDLDTSSSTTGCCLQSLRFAAISLGQEEEESVGVVFKDRGCCFYSCCSTEVCYEFVVGEGGVGGGGVMPFSVKTKREWRRRAEFMVKHPDGSILGFIDKEKNRYTLTMGENLRPGMKAGLVGFVIAMDTMDRTDASTFNCYLRPSTYVTILFLLLLFFMIGAFLFHFITAMILAWPGRKGGGGCMDEVHFKQDDPFFGGSNGTVGGSSYLGSGGGGQGAVVNVTGTGRELGI